MSSNQNIINGLQTIVTSLSQQADGHALQSRVFQNQGFSKLAQKYADHAAEERGYVDQITDRILDLHGEVGNQAKQEMSICTDAVEWLKYDIEVSRKGLAGLLPIIEASKDDLTTYDILKEYYKDEEDDMHWGEQQLDLIALVGKENWLCQQL